MTIKAAVEVALYAMLTNNFTLDYAISWINSFPAFDGATPPTREQIRRALRDMKCVRRVNGRYIRKGRRVPNAKAVAVEVQS